MKIGTSSRQQLRSFIDSPTLKKIYSEQVHSGGGGGSGCERRVEKRAASKRELSDIALDVKQQLISRKERARVTRYLQRVGRQGYFTLDRR
jgi:hypothetical protein